jgi:hypothetical protein
MGEKARKVLPAMKIAVEKSDDMYAKESLKNAIRALSGPGAELLDLPKKKRSSRKKK